MSYSNKNLIAKILLETDCYINTRQSNKPPIVLPDGSEVIAYLSCRRLITHPVQRKKIEHSLADLITDLLPTANLIVGIATAGIPWACGVANLLNLPTAYARSCTKQYGIGKLIEGNPKTLSKAIVIDDTLFTGKSLIAAIQALRHELNIETVGVVTIASLAGLGTKGFTDKFNVPSYALVDYEDVLYEAINCNILSPEESNQMRSYYQQSKLVDSE